MAGDALQGIYENLAPTSIPFPTIDPQYADLYEAWNNRIQATPVPAREKLSGAFESAASLFRSPVFALVLIALGLLVYLLLRRAQARGEDLRARATERVQATLVKAERPANGKSSPQTGIVEYVLWGRTRTGRILLSPSDRPEPGNTISLLVDPGDPECILPDRPAPKLLVPKLVSFALIAAGLTLLALATF